MEWIWIKMFGSLLLILGLIVGTMWLLKKFMTFSKPASGAAVGMEIAGVLHLGPRRSVYAVKAGGQVILLGVAEHSITYLTQLSESSSSVAGGTPQGAAQPAGANAPFFGMLTERFAGGTGYGQKKQEDAPGPVIESDVKVKKAPSSAAPRKKASKPL